MDKRPLRIYGVTILSDSIGVSIDEAVVQSQSEFVCRTILPWDNNYATWIEELLDRMCTATGYRWETIQYGSGS